MPRSLGGSLAALILLAGCSRGYVPGLGEIMTTVQIHHAKLWFAGEAGNWRLATFELGELREGFADAVELHPTHEEVPVAVLVPKLVDPPLGELDAAIGRRDPAAFTTAYDRLTAACNACHLAADFGFNVIRRPATPPFSNQDFTPAGAPGGGAAPEPAGTGGR